MVKLIEMYLIDQGIANEKAKEQMKYWFMKILFESTEEEAARLEDMPWENLEQNIVGMWPGQ